MDQAGHFRAVLRLDRDDEPAVPDGHDGILQQLLIGGGTDHAVELFPDAQGRGPHFAADIGKGRGGAVRYLLLRYHHGPDLFLEVFVRHQDGKPVVQARLYPLAVAAPVRNRADDPKGFRDIQQFPQREGGAGLRPPQGVVDVFHLAEGRGAEARHELIGGIGFVHQAFCLK